MNNISSINQEKKQLRVKSNDGCGIAFYEEDDVNLLREAMAASASSSLEFIRNREFNRKTIIFHIGKATQDEATLRDSNPFVCEMTSKMNVLALNYKLAAFDQEQKITGRFQHL